MQKRKNDKERSVSTEGCEAGSVDVESEPRLRDLVVESVRRKRASLEGSSTAMTRSSSSASSGRFSQKRRKRDAQLTKAQSDVRKPATLSEEAATREPSNDVLVVSVV